ncbi:hypothetical protein [Massilia sp. erpn]|uniref:hypothetical protein n=1 Tax=Massilia sp. erpn TaxID=2738142 RepID=UPI0021056B86|nr:hypothetical protein [Massilia sp. erpn]UTY57833.1 hypothetical protein HPQ68_11950 [Massilia sp. erpn]
MKIPFRHLASILTAALVLSACAVQHTRTALQPRADSAPAQPHTLAETQELRLNTGYIRQLKAGSQWLHVGRTAEGEVYRPYKDVLTVEGAHIHEAYLVVNERKVVGFYLPAEGSFSKLNQEVAITFR